MQQSCLLGLPLYLKVHLRENLSKLTHMTVGMIQSLPGYWIEHLTSLLSTVPCPAGFSIGQLTVWHLASNTVSKRESKAASKDKSHCLLLAWSQKWHSITFSLFYSREANFGVQPCPSGRDPTWVWPQRTEIFGPSWRLLSIDLVMASLRDQREPCI